MRYRIAVCLLLACLISVSTLAQSQASPVPQKTLLIKAGRLLDVRTGNYQASAGVLVEGERIKEVGPLAEIQAHAPRNAAVIDLSGATILPGLIDCHNHVLGDLSNYSPMRDLRNSSAMGAIWGVHNLQIWLDHGFTGLRDAGESDQGYGQMALRDGVQQGLIRGPRMQVAGSFISLTGGHGDADVLAPDQALPRRPNLVDSAEQVAVAVRRDIKYGADWIKLMATGGVADTMSDFNVQELSEQQMTRAVEVAHRARKRVMAHAEGTEGIKAAIRAGVDSIEHGTMLDDEGAALMAQRGTWLVPTLSTFEHGAAIGGAQGQEPATVQKVRDLLPHMHDAFQRALKAHVKMAFGLDDDPRFLPQEFVSLVGHGLPPLAAIQAATINAAELLGWQDSAGVLEPGKYADIIAVAGDPLKDISVLQRVAFVMKGGAVVKDELHPR